ncbi:hypothetical protein U1Q18_036270, partial [Sarracenia purpurea var. burkii]
FLVTDLMVRSQGHSSSGRRRGRGRRSNAGTSRSRISAGGVASRTRGATARDTARQPHVVRITGNPEEDLENLQDATEAALARGRPEVGEVPGTKRVPTADVVPPPSLLAGLRTCGFRPGTPFFTSVERGADFTERALTKPDNEALPSFSNGTLI